MWLSLADSCRDAEDIFAYLKTHRIGLTHAVLYTSWARVAEQSNKLAFAEQILTYAIGKKLAQPAAVLKTELAGLQHRVAAYKAAAHANGGDPNTTPAQLIEIANAQLRKPLSHLSKERTINGATTTVPTHHTTTPAISAAGSSSAVGDSKSNRRFKVYTDEPTASGGDSAVGGLSASLLTDSKQQPSTGGKAPSAAAAMSESISSKENQPAATKWTE